MKNIYFHKNPQSSNKIMNISNLKKKLKIDLRKIKLNKEKVI